MMEIPNGKSSFIERNTVLIPDGDILKYSIDRDEAAGKWHISGNFHGNKNEPVVFLPKLAEAFRSKGIEYSLECEKESDGEFITYEIE